MKNISIIIAFIALIFSACSKDFLNIKQITSKTEGTYYATPADAQEALVGCYDALQVMWSSFYPYEGVALPVASDVMSDLCFGGTGFGDPDNYPLMDEFDQTVSPGDLNLFEGDWVNYYKGIYRCNILISKLSQVNWGKDLALKGKVEAEARFLRAYFYFDMVRMFERVPLLTEPSKDNIPQSAPDLTYKLIAEDLKFAIDNGDTTIYSKIATNNYGHANKWAAEALMARVYLYYTGYYGKTDLVGLVTKSDALAYLENVISKSGYGLVSNFSDLWPAAASYEAAKAGKPISKSTYAGETNKEVVFAIKYTYTSNYSGNTDGNGWMVINGLRGANFPKYGYSSGWGACSVVPSVYTSWDATDKRRDASILAIVEEGITSYTQTQIDDQKEYTGYFTKKYIPICDSAGNDMSKKLGGADFMVGQFQDYFVIRYADVLLMAAELGSLKAVDYVNLVRGRAGLTTPLASVDKDIIYEERLHEFAFEGIRYWDLLRYDNTLTYAANKIAFNGTVINSRGNKKVQPKVIDSNNFKNKRGLFQIPLNQITLSGEKLTQNPGWE